MSNPSPESYGKKRHFVLNFFATLGLFLIFAILLAIFYIPNRDGDVNAEIVENRIKTRTEVEAKQQENLSGYKWIDKENGVVHIPIETAMDAVVSDLNQ